MHALGALTLPGMPWPLPWPFDRSYMQLALVAGVIVGATAPLIGVFIVQKGMSLMGDGIGHVAVAGIGASLLMGTSPTWTALVVAIAAALLIEFLRSRGSATGDLALALVFYGGIAAGVVLASRSSTNTNLQPYLFGSILTATAEDVWTIVALGAGIAVAMAIAGRALFAVVLDEGSARVEREGEVLATLGPGDTFGEQGLMAKTQRNATVVAAEDMRLIHMTKFDLNRIKGSHPEFVARIDAIAAERS